MTAAAPSLGGTVRSGRSTYSTVAIVLHWLIAALLLTNIGLAWYFGTLKGPAEVAPLALHKSIGITVLLLTLVRIGWRFASPPPPLPDSLRPWEIWAAKATHVLFYLIMLGMPLSGWAMVSASPLIRLHPTVLYGVLPWPAVPYGHLDSDALHGLRKLFGRTHAILAWVAYFTIAIHVLAALKHQFLDRDDVMGRMLPLLRRRRGVSR
jgi:cytochrome b561